MALIEAFLKGIDSRWKPTGDEPVLLQVIGSAALMLQTDYERGTKDGDILESRGGASRVDAQLVALAGKDTDLHKQFRLYVDLVRRSILFLPQRPLVNDVVLSKLKRYNNDDANDVRAMADRDLIDHAVLVERFKAAADWFSLDARAPDVPKYLKKLRTVERDILLVAPAEIELPPECTPDD